jgi:hypothetical protein
MNRTDVVVVRGRKMQLHRARALGLLTADELAAIEAPSELDAHREADRPRLTPYDLRVLRAAQARANARRSGVALLGTGEREGA